MSQKLHQNIYIFINHNLITFIDFFPHLLQTVSKFKI